MTQKENKSCTPICCEKAIIKVDLLKQIKQFIDNTDDNWNYITPTELNKLLPNDKFFLLDIRKKEDYSKAHIKGTTNIFWKDLFKQTNLKKLPCPKHQPDHHIILICYVGHTASQTLVLLRLLGFNVTVLKFGMGKSPIKTVPVKGWLDFGYETTMK